MRIHWKGHGRIGHYEEKSASLIYLEWDRIDGANIYILYSINLSTNTRKPILEHRVPDQQWLDNSPNIFYRSGE